MRSFNSFLKLLHIQWEQAGSEEITETVRDMIGSQLEQSQIESQFISISKSKHINEEQYLEFMSVEKPSPFFSTYLFLVAIIKEYYSQTDNMLSDLSPTLQTHSQIQINMIETICDCLEYMIQEYESPISQQGSDFIKKILFDAFHQVAGNVTLYISTLMKREEISKIADHKKITFVKAFSNLQKLLKLNLQQNFSDKHKLLSFIYQVLLANSIFYSQVQEISIQDFLIVFDLFQDLFLKNHKQLQDLCDIEQFQEITFIEVFCECIKHKFHKEQCQQFALTCTQSWSKEILAFDDIHYYLVYQTLVVGFEFIDLIEINTDIISKRIIQIVDLVRLKNQKAVGALFYKMLNTQNSSNILKIINDIFGMQGYEISLQFDTLFGDQLLLIHDKTLVKSYIDTHLSRLSKYILSDTQNIQLLINFIINLSRSYSLFTDQQKIDFSENLIKFYSTDTYKNQPFKKYDPKLLFLIKGADQQLYQQIIKIGIGNSIKSIQHSYCFLIFIQDSINYNKSNCDAILNYLLILVESCKKGKPSNSQLNYKCCDGSRIIDSLISNMQILISIIKVVFEIVLKEMNQDAIYIEIYNTITYLIYQIYWCVQDKSKINLQGIQNFSLELSDLYYKFSINFYHQLQKMNLLQNFLFTFINNINTIAFGYDYYRQITDQLFDENNCLIDINTLFNQLTEKSVSLKLVYNKYYEITFAILFELPNIVIEKKFNLKLLEYLLMTQISLILTFTEYLPKFIFYLRVERDESILKQMQALIIIVLVLNQDSQLLKQLFETLSYHQSSILMNDLEHLQLDLQDQEEITSAYRIANLPKYRIPLFSQGANLIRLVDDMRYFSRVVKYILEIFIRTFQQWQVILKSLQKQSALIHLQGGSSSLQVTLQNKLTNPTIQIQMVMRLLQQENAPKSSQFLDKLSFGFGSFLVNSEYVGKQIIFSLIYDDEYEITLCIHRNIFVLIIKNGESQQEIKFGQKIDFYNWFNLKLTIKDRRVILEVEKQSETYNNNQLQTLDQRVLTQIIIGVNLGLETETRNNEKFQSQFLESFILLHQSFEGQISLFDCLINDQQLRFEQCFTHKTLQDLAFINSGVVIDQQMEFDDIFFMTNCTKQPLICCQNVYVLDIKSGLDFIHQHGGYSAFFMILDVLYIVYEKDSISDSEELLINILQIFEVDISIDIKQVQRFLEKRNLEILEDHCKQVIVCNQKISDKLIFQLLKIWDKISDDKNSYSYVLSILKILDNQFTSSQQIDTLMNKISFQKYMSPSTIQQLSNIQLVYLPRRVFTSVSVQIASKYFTPNDNYFFSYSLGKCQKNEKKIIKVDYASINELFKIVKNQEIINLLTLDILQLCEALLEECLAFKYKQKQEEEQPLNYYKNVILQILERQNNSYQISQYFMISTEVQDKLFELTFSIYFKIVQKIRINSKKDTDLYQIQNYIDIFNKSNQNEIGPQFIQRIFELILQYQEDEPSLNILLKFLNQLYRLQIMKDNIKESITLYFVNLFKNHILKKQKQDQLLKYLIQFSEFPQLIKHLMPHTISKIQNQSELFTYITIYLLEYYPFCTSELLYRIHIESNVFSKDSFCNFLQAFYPLIIQLYANKRVQAFNGNEDERKLISIITAFLHIEQCFGEIADLEFVNWDLYSQVIEKGIDLFSYFDLLFCDFYGMTSKGETFSLNDIKLLFEKQKKQTTRVFPNGGFKRLFIQLIAPFIRVPQMKRVILKYQQKFKFSDVADPNSVKIIKSFILQEFKTPLLDTNSLKAIGATSSQSSKVIVKSVKNQDITDLLVYYALASEEQLDEIVINNLKEIFDKTTTSQIQEWQNINWTSLENMIYFNDRCLETIVYAYNNLSEQRKTPNSKPLQNTFDLTQIDQIRDETSKAIQISLFMQVQIDYQFIHLLWLLYPKLNEQDMEKSKSNLSAHRQSSLSDISFPAQRDSLRKQWERETQELASRQGLWYFVDNYLDILYQELNNFIDTQEFKYEILENLQLKLHVCPLEDVTRRRQQLIKVKMKNIFKPYLKQNQGRKRQQTLQDTSSLEKSKNNLNNSFTITLQKSEIMEESLSQSITKRGKRRQSIRSEQTIINNQLIIINNKSIQHSNKGNQQSIIDLSQTSFRKGSAENNMNGNLKFICEYITQEGAFQGVFQFNDKNNSFTFKNEKFEIAEVFQSPDLKQPTDDINFEILLSNIQSIHTKRFLLSEIAIEIFLNRQNIFFNFYRNDKLKEVQREFLRKKINIITNLREEFNKQKILNQWCEGQLTNFEYLMSVNTYSGRSYNDLSQYFVFPWVLKNYKQQTMDFDWKKNTKCFRDLKIPIGAVEKTPEIVIKEYKERAPESLEENFMYGSHYSNAAIVFNYLIRLEPFNELHFSLQKNKFDVADRLFSNIDILWENSKRQDNKELIPEFYYMPEFLQNINLFDFGTLQSTKRVEDVILPRWVKTQTAEEFIFRMRQALESEYVSQNLNNWIDLIFGIHNNGENAIKTANLFHYLTYEQNIKTLQSQKIDPSLLKSYLSQVYYFGQTPQQLFGKHHPAKQKYLQLFTNGIPNFRDFFAENRMKNQKTEDHNFIYNGKLDPKNERLEILGIFPVSNQLWYIITNHDERYNKLRLIELKGKIEEIEYHYPSLSVKQQIPLPEIKTEGCNPQNLFTFIYEKPYTFGDGYDSQNHSIYEEQNNKNFYFCLAGFVDKEIKFYELRKPITELQIDVSQTIKRQKRVSCLRYHSYHKILAVGSLDGLLQVYQVQFDKFAVKGTFSKQLKSGVICIDMTDLYVLAVDQRNYATLLNTDGDTLYSIFLDCNDKVWQCCIQAQFLVFKSQNSFISVYTINCKQYISMTQIIDKQTKNIVFTTPFSSKFLLYACNYREDQQGDSFLNNGNNEILVIDFFDLKLQQQQFCGKQHEKINLRRNGKPNRAQGVSAIHISFERKAFDSESALQHMYLVAVDGQIVTMMDEERDMNAIIRRNLRNTGLIVES